MNSTCSCSFDLSRTVSADRCVVSLFVKNKMILIGQKMDEITATGSQRQILAGETLFNAGDEGPVWRVDDGVLVFKQDFNQMCLPICLALPGDVIGIETKFDRVYHCTCVALIDTQVSLHQCSENLMDEIIEYGIRQRQWRIHEMVKMHNGSAQHRIDALLACLSEKLNGRLSVLDMLPNAIAELLAVPKADVLRCLQKL